MKGLIFNFKVVNEKQNYIKWCKTDACIEDIYEEYV